MRQLVAFIRNWEPTAPDRRAEAMTGDPARGRAIFNSTCFICHGDNGQGTGRAPALNDRVKLAQFDDEWYADTIANGRPAKGMPTWGTVLSPDRIRNLVALLRAWQRGETVSLPGPAESLEWVENALKDGEIEEAEHLLEGAARAASGEQLAAINEALAALNAGDRTTSAEALERAISLGGESMPGMDAGGESLQPGEAEVRAALDDLKMGMSADAASKPEAALGFAQGGLKEAIEHTLADLNAGKIDEAHETPEKALGANSSRSRLVTPAYPACEFTTPDSATTCPWAGCRAFGCLCHSVGRTIHAIWPTRKLAKWRW